jgi:hypothetical protein
VEEAEVTTVEENPSKLKTPAMPPFSLFHTGFDSGKVIGIGSRACSRNCKTGGFMMTVSSGMPCNVIHANKVFFLVELTMKENDAFE